MIPQDLRRTVEQLVTKTTNGQVLWETADTWGVEREGDFAFNGGKFVVVINTFIEGYNNEGPTHYMLKFLNTKGAVALECNVSEGEKEDFKIMAQLYDLARRRANRADKILEDLNAMLEGEGNVGKRPPPPPKDHPQNSDDIPF